MNDGVTAPQAPETGTGRMKRLLGPFYFNGVFWYGFPYWAMRCFPLRMCWLFIFPFCTGFFIALGGVRRGLRVNHGYIDPSAGWWTRTWRAYQTLYYFSWCLAERYRQCNPKAKMKFDFEGVEHWESARAGGRGLVLVTSHLGGWEIASAIPSSEGEDTVVNVVREEEADPRAQAFMEQVLESKDGATYRTHFVGGEEEQELSLQLYAALRDGEVVALQGDRPRRGGRALPVRFLGTTVYFPPGPAQLARLAGVPLLPVFSFRAGPSHFRVCLRNPIEVPRTRDRHEDVRQATQELARVIEQAVRESPLQWFCLRDVAAYEGQESESKYVDNSPVATSSPALVETSNR